MATCIFCGGLRSDEHECSCLGVYYSELNAGHIPPGLSRGAFSYDVWRKIRGIERELQIHPELGEAWGQERLEKIVTEEETHYQKVQRNIVALQQEKEGWQNKLCK